MIDWKSQMILKTITMIFRISIFMFQYISKQVVDIPENLRDIIHDITKYARVAEDSSMLMF